MVQKTINEMKESIKEKLRKTDQYQEIRQLEEEKNNIRRGHFLLSEILESVSDEYLVYYRIDTNKRYRDTRQHPIEVKIYYISDYSVEDFQANYPPIEDEKRSFEAVFKYQTNYGYQKKSKTHISLYNPEESFNIVFDLVEVEEIDNIKKIIVSESLAGGDNDE
jgi:hypothetical protein